MSIFMDGNWHSIDFPLPRAPEIFPVFEAKMVTYMGFLT
jgi:hypothetical protein